VADKNDGVTCGIKLSASKND